MNIFSTDKSSPSSPRSIYERAASNGLWMGIYFSILFLAMVGSMKWGVLNLVVMTLFFATPYLIFMQMRRTHVAAHGMETVAGLWMQGILTFCCGSLLLCATSYLFLRWGYSDFMYDSCVQILEAYNSTPDLPRDEIYNIAQSIVNNRFVIRPADIAVAYFWMGSFSGSILSLILALIVKRTKIRK